MQDLLDYLLAKGGCGQPAINGDHIEVLLPDGDVKIWHDGYGREYYGHLLSNSGVRTELIQLAKSCGLQTQFMYHDVDGRAAVWKQIWQTLACAMANIEKH
jgi:hypothetical protein